MKRLLIGVAFLLACLWLLFSYRIAIIEYGFNYWAKQHQLELTSLGAISFSAASKTLHLSDAELRSGQSHLRVNAVALSLNHSVVPSEISIGKLVITADYGSVNALRDTYLNSERKAGRDVKIKPDDLPTLNISRLELGLIGFPQVIVPESLSHIVATDLKFNKDELPRFTMTVFSAGQFKTALLAQPQPLFELRASYNDNSWRGRLDIELNAGRSIFNAMLPPALNSLEISGMTRVDFVLSLNKVPELKVAAIIEDLSIVDNDITLIHSLDVVTDTNLRLGEQIKLAPVSILMTQDSQLLLSQKYCARASQLLAMPATNCRHLPESERVSVLMATPLNIVANIDLESPDNWLLAIENATFDIETGAEKINLAFDNTRIGKNKISGDLTLQGTTRRLAAAENTRFALEAQLTKATDISLRVNRAQLKFNQLGVNGVKIDSLDISNRRPIQLVLSEGEIPPIRSTWISTINGVSAQDLLIDNIEGTHQALLSKSELELESNWRVDELQLLSHDIASLENYRPTQLSGKWRLPQQSISAILAIKNPLPPSLSIKPQIENVINYHGKISRGKLHISAKISGKLAASSGRYDDIEMSELESRWRCQSQYGKAISLDCNLSGKLAQFDLGFPVSQLFFNGDLSSVGDNFKLRLSQAGGKLLGGSFSVPPLTIDDFNDITGVVELSDISLAQIVELQQQEGIEITGSVKGRLPINYQNNQLRVVNGRIENYPPGGSIKIDGNATVDQLRLSQPELEFVLDALENLHYNRLSSSINYQPDGETLLKVSIEGRNPEFERPIEFNYSHQENVLQLMRSLRVGDEISKKIEQRAD